MQKVLLKLLLTQAYRRTAVVNTKRTKHRNTYQMQSAPVCK